MITIKLKIKDDISSSFVPFQMKWNWIYRYAFNRFSDSNKKLSTFDAFDAIKNLNNVDDIDLSWKREAFKAANALYKANKALGIETTIFGGKDEFLRLKKQLITVEEFRYKRDIKITMEGSQGDIMGNRKFKFNVDTLECEVKLFSKLKFKVETASKKQMELLSLALKKAAIHQIPLTYSLDTNYLYISFEEKKLKCNLNYIPIENRLLAIDSNPNYIGYSIVDEGNKVIYKEVISLFKIKKKNKKKYELAQISKYINSIALHFKVEMIGFEQLKMKSKDHNKGKNLNRLINNNWSRTFFLNLVRKNANLSNIKVQDIAANYSSTIGCVMHPDETDSIAASLELNRRLRLFKKIYIDKTIEKQDVIFPKWDVNMLPTRWKNMVADRNILNWVQLHAEIKKSKLSYRFLYKDFVDTKSQKVFRLYSWKSLVDCTPCFC